jgi:L-alanine-DL-glutamate epimerase-like enolase superfamily enzyme
MSRTLRAQHDSFPLSQPFRISRGVKTQAEVIAVALEQDGIVGRGEGVPYAHYGESIESALAAIEQARGAVEAGADRTALLGLLPPGAARNAIDCALWDLEARLSGQSVAATIGAAELGRLASALTVVIDTPIAHRRCAAHQGQGRRDPPRRADSRRPQCRSRGPTDRRSQ